MADDLRRIAFQKRGAGSDGFVLLLLGNEEQRASESMNLEEIRRVIRTLPRMSVIQSSSSQHDRESCGDLCRIWGESRSSVVSSFAGLHFHASQRRHRHVHFLSRRRVFDSAKERGHLN